jgi:hypothetical protein
MHWEARLGSIADRGGVDKRARRRRGATRRTGTRACRCSPTAVEEDEPDEAVPEGCSLEQERQQRGGVMEAKNGDGLSSARGRRKARGRSGEREKMAVRAGDACRHLWGLREHRGGVVRVVTVGVNGLDAIGVGAR